MERLVARNNILLVKDDVGKAKPCTVKLPSDGHVYGKPDTKDQEGARVITSSWIEHKQSKSYVPPKDFKKINKVQAT